MDAIPYGTKVRVNVRGQYHDGEIGVVCSRNLAFALEVRLTDCVHTFHISELTVIQDPLVITTGAYSTGDRVLWSDGPAYGAERGVGRVYGFYVHEGRILARIRFDEPGLDDEDIPVIELSRLI